MNTHANHITEDESLEHELRAALECFETTISIPIVEGELANWGRNVRQTWSDLTSVLRTAIETVHRRQFDEIAETDQEMFKHVEKLQTEDEEIVREMDELENGVRKMNFVFPIAESDPAAPVNESQQKFVDRGIAFVGRVRKQEVAIRTWTQEAFTRDRGIVD